MSAGLESALPYTGMLHVEVKRHVLQHGKNGAEGPLGGGDAMRAMSIADSDVRPCHAGNPLRAGHQRQDQTHTAQPRPDAHGPRGIRIRNPNVDFDVVIKIVGQRDEFDSRREIAQQLRGYCGWVSYTQHGKCLPGETKFCAKYYMRCDVPRGLLTRISFAIGQKSDR